MEPPALFGHLLPVAIPGTIIVGALAMLVMQTPLGPMIFQGPLPFLLLSLIVGILVLGYLVSALQETLSRSLSTWALPPTGHLDDDGHAITLPPHAVERAGFQAQTAPVTIPLGDAYALERSLAGAWGTPERSWDRAAFLQRLTLAFLTSALTATLFLIQGALTSRITPGLASHGLTVLLLAGITAALLTHRAQMARKEAILELLADARALLTDRGEHQEVRRILNDANLTLTGEDPGYKIHP